MADKTKLLLALDMLTVGPEGEAVPERLGTAAAVVRDRAAPWMAEPGIQGFGIGPKVKDARVLPELVLKVYVDSKKPVGLLRQAAPKEVKLPGTAGKVHTDVEAIGKVEREANTTRVRPAVPGFGVGHPNITVGTFGCLVRKRGQPNTLYVLSNTHVLADEGLAAVNDPILQPGRFDGGAAPADVLGKLVQWVPFTFSASTFPAGNVDAAIAEVKKSQVTSLIRKIGVPKGVSSVRRIDMKVQKTGRTTDYTIGVIRDVNYRFALDYPQPGGGGPARVGFRDQVLCTRYTAGGDSGSAVLNMSGKVVGLHFAGSPSSSIFHPIQAVLAALDLEVVTQAF